MSRRRVSPFIGESYLWWIAFSCDWSIDVLFMNHSCYIYWSAPPIPTNPNPQSLPHPNTLSPSEKIVQRTLHHYHSDSRLLLNWYMYFISKSNVWWINFSSDLGITGHGMTHISYIPSSLPKYFVYHFNIRKHKNVAMSYRGNDPNNTMEPNIRNTGHTLIKSAGRSWLFQTILISLRWRAFYTKYR